ncbi:MAG: Rrf2 family transcriptional regulator [Spirochaetaceae bacterium]|jgi:Rrf2 family protein|nr:Rrf2 family transcriptional regulator [Spirochaetaceae bacterium]
MKISSRGRHGIRFLLDLALHYNEGHVTLASIAERQNISAWHLEQVAIILRRTGFIRSIKGSSGGYSLTRRPENISLGEALRTLEGDMLITDPPLPGEREKKYAATVRRVVFDRLNEKISQIIDADSLASLTRNTETSESYTYVI